MTIVDMDQHLYEPRDMWQTYCDPAARHLAISIVDDPLGYPMMSYKGNSPAGSYCWMADAGARTPDGWIDTDPSIGKPHRDQAKGLPAERRYDDLDASFTSPAARLAKLDEWGVDECFLFPQWALEYEGLYFEDDIEGLRVNHGAWNRFAAEIASDGRGRLHPVAYLTMQGDQEWVIAQIKAASQNDLKLASFSAGLINGLRPSHPDNDRIWSAFVEYGVTISAHLGVGVPRFIPKAWIDNDHGTFPALGMSWMDAPTRLMLSDFALNGVFMRHPDLRVAIVEQRATWWLRTLLEQVDGAYRSQPALTGHNVVELDALPSEYIKQRCRFGLLPGEDAAGAIDAMGEIFGFGADYPHVEGVANSVVDFKNEMPRPLDDVYAEKFFGVNALWAIGR